MYKVKFDNGYVVNFENEPTQEDIEEAAKSMSQNILPKPLEKQPKGFLEKIAGKGSLIDKIGSSLESGTEKAVKDIAGMGVSAYNIGKGIQAASKGESYDMSSSANLPVLGETKPFVTGQETFGQAVGKMASGGATVASVIEGGRTLGTDINAIKGGLNVLKSTLPSDVKSLASVATNKAKSIATKIAEKKALKETSTITDIVSPKLTKNYREKILKAGEELSEKELKSLGEDASEIQSKIRSGVETKGKSIFSKLKSVADKETEEIVNTIKDLGVKLKSGKEEVGRNITRLKIAERKQFNTANEIVDNYISGKGSNYIPEDGEKIVDKLTQKFNDIKNTTQKSLDLATDTERTYDKVWKIAKDTLKNKITKNGKLTQKEILDTLREWNYKASDIAAFEGKENIKKIAIKDVRKILRDVLTETLPEDLSKKIDKVFKNQSNLIDAMSNIAEKNQTLIGKKSGVQKVIEKGKKVLPYAIGGSIIGGTAKELFD